MTPRPLLDRRILFFGGKGGVGKTTVAAAYALLSADHGHRTLLVSTDPAPSTGDILETKLGPEPSVVVDGLWAMEIDPEREAAAYIAQVKDNVAASTPPRLAAEVERQIDIARVSPGAEEAALFDRFTRILDSEAHFYDRVIFDTAPTGHTLRLLTLPESMTAWMSGLISRRRKVNVLGKMWRNVAGAAAGDRVPEHDPVIEALTERRRRFERARSILVDSDRTTFVFVIVPERLPISETERAVRVLRKYEIPMGAVVVNQILPPDAEGAFLDARRQRESRYLERIDAAFAELPMYRLTLLERDVVGLETLRQIIAQLPSTERESLPWPHRPGLH